MLECNTAVKEQIMNVFQCCLEAFSLLVGWWVCLRETSYCFSREMMGRSTYAAAARRKAFTSSYKMFGVFMGF
jgi:hypothetical protein